MNDHRILNRFASLADLAAQVAQRDQLLDRIGLQRRRTRCKSQAEKRSPREGEGYAGRPVISHEWTLSQAVFPAASEMSEKGD